MDSPRDRPPSTLAERLKQLFPQASGVSRKNWLAFGRVTLNGQVVRDGRTAVASGDRVALGGETVARVVLPPPLRLVYEDDDLLVVDKPADLLSIATKSERERTAFRMVWSYLAQARPPSRPLIVHRLDRQTSGLVVFAKSTAAKRHLQAQFKANSVTRQYQAVVEGKVPADAGRFEHSLLPGSSMRLRAAGRGEAGGRLAVLRYRVRQRRATTTALELELGTGWRHQIRVQLAAAGHPVVGDHAYGATTDPLKRVCLHATRLGFLHPASGRPVQFDSPPPQAFARVGGRA
jgi:23S rRNA pseudouridine1911/1915/1917 synthase